MEEHSDLKGDIYPIPQDSTRLTGEAHGRQESRIEDPRLDDPELIGA